MKACRNLYSQLWVEALAATHDPVMEFVHGEHVVETSAQEKCTEDALMGEADLWTFEPPATRSNGFYAGILLKGSRRVLVGWQLVFPRQHSRYAFCPSATIWYFGRLGQICER